MKTLESAEILEASGFQARTINEAMEQIRATLSKEHSISPNIYAVIVYKEHRLPCNASYLRTANIFLEAYWRGWRMLSRLANTSHPDLKANHIQMIKDLSEDICIYWGSASAKDVKETMNTVPGVYVIPSHLDTSLLESLRLPPIPEPFSKWPLVMQVKITDTQEERIWRPWESLTQLITEEEYPDKLAEVERETLQWRSQFLSEYESLTSAQVAEESTSTAKNRSAIASRWAREKKIFSIRHEGKTLFPKFQFRDGVPIPQVSKVIEAFPEHATGWDLIFFFSTPNSFIGGRKPLELLREDPDRLASLARAFARPTDAF